MPFNSNLENIVTWNKGYDMLPFPLSYYGWDAVNKQIQQVSKVPPADGIKHKLHNVSPY